MQFLKLILTISLGLTDTAFAKASFSDITDAPMLSPTPVLTSHSCDRPGFRPGGKEQCIEYCADNLFKTDRADCGGSDCREVRTHEGFVGRCTCLCTAGTPPASPRYS